MTKKALFLSGGWEGHEPQETSEFISSELQQFKIQSEIVNDLDVLGDIDFLKNFDIIYQFGQWEKLMMIIGK